MAGGDFPNPSLDFFLELEKELKELLQANVLGYQDFIWASIYFILLDYIHLCWISWGLENSWNENFSDIADLAIFWLSFSFLVELLFDSNNF